MIELISESLSMADPIPVPDPDARQLRPHGSAPQTGRLARLIGGLGRREREVMTVVWKLGNANVQQVAGRLSDSLAYTTVMTTLDRLFRKGLLQRTKQKRAFIYSAAISAEGVEEGRASDLIRRLFSESSLQPDVLVSCLVDALHRYDTDLLDQLESSIRSARTRLHQAGSEAEED